MTEILNFHAVGMAAALLYGFKIDFVRNFISRINPEESRERKASMATQRRHRQRTQYLTPTAWESTRKFRSFESFFIMNFQLFD